MKRFAMFFALAGSLVFGQEIPEEISKDFGDYIGHYRCVDFNELYRDKHYQIGNLFPYDCNGGNVYLGSKLLIYRNGKFATALEAAFGDVYDCGKG